MSTWKMIEITDMNKAFVPTNTTTVTLTYVVSGETPAWAGKTYTLVPQHPAERCPGNCALHPLMLPLFREMMRGDVAWGTLCQ